MDQVRGQPASKIDHPVPCAVAVDSAGKNGVLCVETIGKIRRRRLVQGDSISAIAPILPSSTLILSNAASSSRAASPGVARRPIRHTLGNCKFELS